MNETKPYLAVAADNDQVHVWDDHFGEAPLFYVFDADGRLVETRANPYWDAEHEHGQHTGQQRMMMLLPDCGVFIARHMGNGQRVLEGRHGVEPFITTETTILGAVQAYLSRQPDHD